MITLRDVGELRDTMVPNLTFEGVLVDVTTNAEALHQLRNQPEVKSVFVKQDTPETRKELSIKPWSTTAKVSSHCTISLSINYTDNDQIKKLLKKMLDETKESVLLEV